MSVYFVYFCWSALLKLLRSAVVRWWSFAAGVNLQEAPGVEGVEINLPFGDSEIGG